MAVKLLREENAVSFYVPTGEGYTTAAGLIARGWKGTSTEWNDQVDLLRFKLGDRTAEEFASDLNELFPDRDFEVDVVWA